MKKICTICARGGSQGVKNKNIIPLCGKPLIAHTILQAKETGLFDVIAVSSDSKTIRDVALEWGADEVIERPAELATSTAGKLPVIQHAVTEIEQRKNTQFDVAVDLDATSPLRTVDDILQSVTLLMQSADATNLITGCHARRSPYFNLVERNKNGYVSLSKKTEVAVVRRQDAPICFDLNASIYVWKRNALFDYNAVILEHTLLFEMPEERSIDIDTPLDLKIVRMLAKNRQDLNGCRTIKTY